MRINNLDRRGLYGPVRGISPNSFAQRSNPNISVHSEHLWNMMEDIELFPDEIYQLLRYEQRNLASYKKSIEREKYKVGQAMQALKRQIQHNIDDLKISVCAELDNIYKNYMTKYATLKGQIMEIKRLKDEIELNIEAKTFNYSPKFSSSEDRSNGMQKYSMANNSNIIKSMERNTLEAKKYQMSNYIAEMQKQKIIPLSDLGRQLVILTQYQNGFYQSKEFQAISNNLIDHLKANLRDIYDRKYQFIREPDSICQKENRPVLEELNQPQPQIQVQVPAYASAMAGLGSNFRKSGVPVSQMYPDLKQASTPAKLEETKFIGIASEQQCITYEWAQNITLTSSQGIRNASSDIILCALEIGRNLIAVGSKDGIITIYDATSGEKKANLRGHRASICKLAQVNLNGKRYLASGSDIGCSSIVLWDTNTWNIRMKIQYHKAAVTSIVDLQDNRSLISGSYDKTINVYNLNDEGKIMFNLPANRASVTAVLMNCNGNKLITCGLDDTISVYQIVRGANRLVDTMFLQRQIQNNTMICSIVTSVLHPDLVFLGTKDGKIKLINIDRGQAYKIYDVCNNAVIEMVAIERQSKVEFPLAICWPCGEQCLKIVNTEHGKVTTQSVRGKIQFGCGIGPKSFFLSNGRTLAMLSQSQDRQQINLFRLQINN